MHKTLIIAGITAALLSGCAETGASVETQPQSLTSGISDKTLRGNGTVIRVGSDGTIAGTTNDGREIAGVWEERNGQFCRTVSKPAEVAGTECQDLVFRDGKVIANTSRGQVTFDVSDT